MDKSAKFLSLSYPQISTPSLRIIILRGTFYYSRDVKKTALKRSLNVILLKLNVFSQRLRVSCFAWF